MSILNPTNYEVIDIIYHWLDNIITFSHHLTAIVPVVVVGVDGPEHGLVVHDEHQGSEGDIEHVHHHLDTVLSAPSH